MYVVIKPKPGSCRCVVDLFLILNRADAFVVISSYIQRKKMFFSYVYLSYWFVFIVDCISMTQIMLK